METKRSKINFFILGLLVAYLFVVVFTFFRVYSFQLYPVYSSEEQMPDIATQLTTLNYWTANPSIADEPPIMCEWDAAQYLLFSKNGEPLIYYSHFTSILIFLVLFAFTFFRFKDWQGHAFRLMISSYIIWLLCDIILWSNESMNHVMFFWTLLVLIETLIFIGAYVFFIQFIGNRNSGIKLFDKILITLLLIPTFITSALGLSAIGFDYTTCDRNVWEGIGVYYGYFVEFFLFILIVLRTLIELGRKESKGSRAKLLLTSFGVCLLFIAFIGSNFIATYTDTYTTSQLGHIAVPIFAIFIAYITVKYESLDPRILSIDMLTAALGIILASLFFVESPQYQLYANIVATLLAVPLGIILTLSMRREVNSRKEIQKLAIDLSSANNRLEELDKQKSEFISIASHQLRTPLTAIRGYISLALEGAYGPVKGTPIEDIMNKMYTIDLRLSQLVEDLLNVSKIEAGKVQYKWEQVALEPVAKELFDMFTVLAEKRGLKLYLANPEKPLPMMTIDVNKIKEILSNLIDNAIKYTEKGSVTIRLEREETLARIVIQDTGIGISKEDVDRLFGKFIRTETTQKMDSGGSGLGLFVGKTFVEGHGGKVYATSDGVGMGSSFIVELPLINPNVSQ
jgi:signal transduction histidine kinase